MQKTAPVDINEDLLLWHLTSQGDKKAFSSLFSKYYTILYSYSRYYISAEDAEEAVQDVMMWLWVKREEFTPNGSMQQYLLKSVKNRCLSILRKQDLEFRNDDLFFVELDSFYESTDPCVVKELQTTIEKAIADLPETYRITFEMMRFQNKSRQEIATDLGISVKTVDYRMQQSLKILKEELKEYLPFLVLWGIHIKF